MIEYYDKEEFMKAPVEIITTRETCEAMDIGGRVIMPFTQEPSFALCIGGREYDIRDLVYRLLRAEGEVVALMGKVADLQTHIQALEDKMSEKESEITYDTSVLDNFLKGEWKIRID